MHPRGPRLRILATVAAALVATAACTAAAPRTAVSPEGDTTRTLRAFRSEREFTRFYRGLAAEQRRERRRYEAEAVALPPPPAPPPVMATPMPAAPAAPGEPVAKAADESVTNVQHAGVDEGGIVKTHGDHLVILRRGRLFTVAIGDSDLRPVAAVDAFAPGVDPRGSWYDEMLVADSTVVIIGYSYDRGGTEVGLFRIGRDGSLAHRSTYHLRSNDYYSSRNYASRLVDGKLVFYTPLELDFESEDPAAALPALRRWHPGVTEGEWRPVVSGTRIYRPERSLDLDEGLALHTVTVCDLGGAEMSCEGTGVLGPQGHDFYVSPQSVYVWVSDWRRPGQNEQTAAGPAPSLLVRLPLSGAAPTALGVAGSPVDQFSFLESDDRHLNVVVRSEPGSQWMWGAERARGGAALLRVPLASFGDGGEDAPAWRYRPLPTPGGYTFQNRFVGDHLLYGTGAGWGRPQRRDSAALYAVPWRGGDLAQLTLTHGVDRIEALGRHAVVVGTDGRDLHFSAVRLAARPEVAGRYTRSRATQGETRSHGFFYRPESETAGVLGLPVAGMGRPGYEQLRHGSASILFLRNEALRFRELGELASGTEPAPDDGCRASCVDWYGNARPLFLRGRVFALLGYEIVEGAVDDGRVREVRRISYAPRRAVAER